MVTFHPTGTSLLLLIALAPPLPAQRSEIFNHLAAEIRRESPPLSHPDLAAYCQALGRRLSPGLTIDFEVVRSESAEPIPLPGGPIFVPIRVLLATRSQAELAALLAHALAHATQSPRQVGGWYFVPHTPPEILIPLAAQSARQELELAADRQALELLQRSGFATAALGEYLRRVLRANHPRLAHLPPPASYTPTPDEGFLQLQALVRSLLPVRRPPTLHREPSAKLE